MPILGNVIPPSNALTPTTVTATGKVTAGAKLDMNGTEIILDADADTSITADTDDQIDIRIAGADDFRFTADTLSVLSGSTLNIDSGATIANSGTATGFGPSVAAAAGIMQANANFVDAVIFGPAMDPVDWSGRTAASTASLMLATVEETGGTSELNIWDLTSTTIAGATPLYTVTIGQVATSITALMGYVMVGTQGAPFFYAPHDNDAWGALTTGWPRRIHSTNSALTNNNVVAVASGFSDQPAYDGRTGGPMPTFALVYGTGVDETALLKDDGYIYNYVGTVGMKAIGISNGYVILSKNTQGDGLFTSNRPISGLNNDDYGGTDTLHNDAFPYALGIENGMDVSGSLLAGADPHGLSFAQIKFGATTTSATSAITRAYNTGYMVGDIRGAWLANSKTVDRSYKANTLTEAGTVTEGVASTSTELKGYSGFSADNYLHRASDADWDVITTGSAYLSCWVKSSGNSAQEYFINFGNSGATVEFILLWDSAGRIEGRDDGATAQTSIATSDSFDDGIWHKADFVRVSSTERYLYVDGVLKNSSTTDAGSLSDDGNLPLYIGILAADGSSGPADDSTLALAKLSVTAPTATQIRQMYDAEKGMFVASAKCLLQSGSTDAVLDVSVDPITSKVAVTQTDSQMIWDGLVMESAPAVNAGASEHNLLYGGDRVEINSVNLYATIAAKNLRGDLDLVRGMKASLPAGPDLSKAKAWLNFNMNGGGTIYSSYNIKSMTDNGVGVWTVNFAVPFKSSRGPVAVASGEAVSAYDEGIFIQSSGSDGSKVQIYWYNDAAAAKDTNNLMAVFFGELENE